MGGGLKNGNFGAYVLYGWPRGLSLFRSEVATANVLPEYACTGMGWGVKAKAYS